jgi:thiol-disulfide isomerase/thioredoxin
VKGLLFIAGAVALLACGLAAARQQERMASPTAESGLVGQPIHLPKLSDLNGEAVAAPVDGAPATVIALSSITCPLCQKYGPSLAAIEDDYQARGVRFIFLNPMTSESAGEMAQLVKTLGLDGAYVHDPRGVWTTALQAKTTTETFVLNAKGQLVYRGAIDDQYAIGAALPAPKNRWLADALDAALEGRLPKVASTSAPGCLLNGGAETGANAVPTFHADIQPIIQKSCLPCHRSEGVAPFSLDGYEAVKSRAKMLDFVIEAGIMPPWFAEKGSGPWRNDMSLPEGDHEKLKAWIESGMPKGDPNRAPAPIKFESGWTIGRPDAVFSLPEPVKIEASGVMPYVNINVPTGFTEDKWVERIEVVPGDRRAVHHVLVFVRTPADAPDSEAGDLRAELSGFFGVYVPGNSSLIYPDGLAKRIPKGAILRFQIHYTPYGQASQDQTKIGLVFAENPPRSEVQTASLANLFFSIPPGAQSHPVEAQIRVPRDVQILSFLPHMHVRGSAARYELQNPQGSQVLLNVPRYDFNWQLNYVLAKPLDVRAGETIKFTAWYDNSDQNPANPDPSKTVRWGPQTFNEMHLGYVEYIVPGLAPGERAEPLRPGIAAVRGAGILAAFRRLDRNGDGVVTQEEAGAFWKRIEAADGDRDGRLTLAEAQKHFGGGSA